MGKKKFISLILCFIIIFVISIPPKETEAVVPAFAIPSSAIPATVKISSGAIAVGGAVVAGILTGLGLDNIEFDIVSKAQEIWDGFSSSVSDAWEGLFDFFWGSSANSIPIDQSFKSSLVSDAPLVYLKSHAGLIFAEATRTVTSKGTYLRYKFENDDYYFLVLNSTGTGYAIYTFLEIYELGSYGVYFFDDTYLVQYSGSVPQFGDILTINSSNWSDIRDNVLVNTQATLGYLNIHKRESDPSVFVISSSVLSNYNQMRSDFYGSVFPLATANEIYFPFDSIYPYAGSLGVEFPLHWNDDLQAFVLPDNPAVPYEGEIAWHIPAPTIYETDDGEKKVGYITSDGRVMDALTGDIVGSGDIPVPDVPSGFFDGVLQGIYSILDFLENIADNLSSLVSLLTTGLIGDVSNIQFSKLTSVGYDLTYKFPFSIPWDIGRAFNAVFGSFSGVDTPVWELNINFLGQQYSFEISIPDYLLNWFPIVRTFILVLFDIGIILSVRHWLGGAS